MVCFHESLYNSLMNINVLLKQIVFVSNNKSLCLNSNNNLLNLVRMSFVVYVQGL
jgi:hypothetical protein